MVTLPVSTKSASPTHCMMSPSASAASVHPVLGSYLLPASSLGVVPAANPQHVIKTFPRTFSVLRFSKPVSKLRFCLGFCLLPIMPIQDTLWQFLLEVAYIKKLAKIPVRSSPRLQSLGSGLERWPLARIQLHPQCTSFVKVPKLEEFLGHGVEA